MTVLKSGSFFGYKFILLNFLKNPGQDFEYTLINPRLRLCSLVGAGPRE